MEEEEAFRDRPKQKKPIPWKGTALTIDRILPVLRELGPLRPKDIAKALRRRGFLFAANVAPVNRALEQYSGVEVERGKDGRWSALHRAAKPMTENPYQAPEAEGERPAEPPLPKLSLRQWVVGVIGLLLIIALGIGGLTLVVALAAYCWVQARGYQRRSAGSGRMMLACVVLGLVDLACVIVGFQYFERKPTDR